MEVKTLVVKIDSRRPHPEQIRLVAAQMLAGKIVAFPTETVYGIAACASQKGAVERIRELKKRSDAKPFSYHIGHQGVLEELHIVQSHVLKYLISQFWPGPVTLLALNQDEEKVGIRYPKHVVASQIINQCGELVVATSANLSDQKSARTAQEVLSIFPTGIDLIVDGGPCDLGEDSTILDATMPIPQIVRRGAWADRVDSAIEKIKRGQIPRKRILIVCTGNTCRSPMAEGWIRSQLRKEGYGVQIEVSSCGIYAQDGRSASMDTILTLKNDEVTLDDFKTRMCRREDVLNADLILAMAEEHQHFIRDLCPQAKDKIIVLNVPDPMGMTVEFYQQCYETIKENLLKIWPEIVE